MKYVYFIAYDYPEGVGRTVKTMDFKIVNGDQLKEIEKNIKREMGKQWIIINNFILMSTEG